MSDHLADRLARVDVSLAKQLQASMEFNARMTTALRALQDNPSTPSGTAKAIAQILKDCA
jgi:hypothetical protein